LPATPSQCSSRSTTLLCFTSCSTLHSPHCIPTQHRPVCSAAILIVYTHDVDLPRRPTTLDLALSLESRLMAAVLARWWPARRQAFQRARL
jgi:hypothetical protein